MLNPSILIPCAAYVLCIFLVAARLVKHKKMRFSLGNCLLVLPRKKSYLVIATCAASGCLIGLLFFRQFPQWMAAVFALCGVMAIELALNDMLLRTVSGVYENGIITDGKLILRADIVAFPSLAYENQEDGASSLPETVLQTVTKNACINLLFENAEHRNAAVVLVKEWV